jgi:hypothetical protein
MRSQQKKFFLRLTSAKGALRKAMQGKNMDDWWGDSGGAELLDC